MLENTANMNQNGMTLAAMYPEYHPVRNKLLGMILQRYFEYYKAKSTSSPSRNAATETDANTVPLNESDGDDGKDVNVNVANNVSKGDN